jgi:hypothetical protein
MLQWACLLCKAAIENSLCCDECGVEAGQRNAAEHEEAFSRNNYLHLSTSTERLQMEERKCECGVCCRASYVSAFLFLNSVQFEQVSPISTVHNFGTATLCQYTAPTRAGLSPSHEHWRACLNLELELIDLPDFPGRSEPCRHPGGR